MHDQLLQNKKKVNLMDKSSQPQSIQVYGIYRQWIAVGVDSAISDSYISAAEFLCKTPDGN